MAGSTISTKVTIGVTLGSGTYASPLAITGSGDIAPSAYGATALSATISAGSILNFGTISGGAGNIGSYGGTGGDGGGGGGIGVYLAAGSVTNIGTVAGGSGGNGGGGTFGGNGGKGGVGVDLVAGSLTNNGTVTGGGAGDGGNGVDIGGNGNDGGVGVYIVAGNLTNQGTILGGAGGFGGRGAGGLNGTDGGGGIGVVFHNGGTLADAGFIGGGSGTGGTADAVYFGSGASRLILDPGARFSGSLVANAAYSNVLELASGSSVGTLSGGIGAEYLGFTTITVDAGAHWTLSAANLINVGVSLIVLGSLTNAGTITGGYAGSGAPGSAGGIGVDLSAGSLTNTGKISGGAGVTGSYGGTGGVGGSGGTGGAAVDLTGGSLTNNGTVGGGTGGAGGGGTNGAGGTGGTGGSGGIAVDLTGGSLANSGTVTGGMGGIGGNAQIAGGGGSGGGGGFGVDLVAGSLTNQGRVTGGTGGSGGGDSRASNSAGGGGAGGAGVYTVAGNLTNQGTIVGGAGGIGGIGGSGPGGNGGIGVLFHAGGTLTDAGFIGGGYGNGSFADAVYFGSGASRLVLSPGASLAGAVVANATFSNVLELAPGTGTLNYGIGAGHGDSRGLEAGYRGFNTIIVDAGADWTLRESSTLAAGVSMTNAGTISGSLGSNGYLNGFIPTGGYPGGTGVTLAGGSLTNDNTITGGGGGAGGSGGAFAPGASGSPGGTGVYVVAGDLVNRGTITGGAGGAGGTGTTGTAPNGFGGSGVVFHAGGTLTDAGFIGVGSGTGGFAHAVYFGSGASQLILDPGASFSGSVVADAAYGNVLELATGSSAGSIAGVGNAITGFNTIQFDPGAQWFLAGSTVGLAAGQTIDGFALGDTLELTGFVTAGDSFTGTGLVLTGAGGPKTIGIQGAFTTADFIVTNDGTNSFIEHLACFAAGTRIRTPRGEVAVEALRPGETVLAYAGEGRTVPKPIVWIGHRSVDCRRHPEPRKVWPVRVRAGAFGDGAPGRDLFLSPDHAVFVDESLIPIRHLINGSSIEQVPTDAVTYYHIELPRHDVLLAEGLPAESYLDAGDRSNFADNGGAMRLFADFSTRASDACALWEAYGRAPLIVSGAKLDAVRRRLSERAATRERRKAAATGRAVA